MGTYEPELEEWFHAMLDRTAGQPVSERFYRVAGKTIHMVSTRSGIDEKLAPALRHLHTDRIGPPDLSVHVYFGNHADEEPPELPSAILARERSCDDSSAQQSLFLVRTDTMLLSYLRDVETRRILDLTLFDTDRRAAAAWIGSDADAACPLAAPLRNLLGLFFSASGTHLLHAAAVAVPGKGAVLFVGKAGAGKSTCALSCLAEGHVYLGDDSVLVASQEPPTVHSLYGSARVPHGNSALRHMLQRANVRPRKSERGKDLVFLSDGSDETIALSAAEFRVKAIVAPSVEGRRETSVRALSSLAMLQEIVSSSLYHVAGFDGRSLSALAAIVRSVPCFRMHLGDPESVPRTVLKLLASD